ncbi:MAG: molybdopterin-guanine dinucleotide biosynthesis protein A [Halioglobus sp.]|jgi:molybdopterin-guanine dinucleotide biosynthesis protein A
MRQKNQVTGLILAGGKGRRVQGQDKGLLSWRGKKLIEHVADRLAPQVGELIISCNRNIPAYSEIGDIRVQDSRADFQGPLAGIEAAMEHVKTDVLVVVACDNPLLPLDLVERLNEAPPVNNTARALISYAHDGKREHYLCCAIRTSLYPSLTSYLEDGNRAVRDWFGQHLAAPVDFSDQPEAFVNFNSLEAFSKH